MKHSQKIALARRLPRTAEDDKYNEGMFSTEAWEARKARIASAVKRKHEAAHARAVARREALKDAPKLITRRQEKLRRITAARIELRRKRQAKYRARNPQLA